MTEETDKERYLRLAHAIQSGVAIKMSDGAKDTEPKHLRVGIDISKAEMGGFVRLLIAKGLFTEAEYVKAITDGLEREVAALEKELSAEHGQEIRLA